jgi:hypothetical protein
MNLKQVSFRFVGHFIRVITLSQLISENRSAANHGRIRQWTMWWTTYGRERGATRYRFDDAKWNDTISRCLRAIREQRFRPNTNSA